MGDVILRLEGFLFFFREVYLAIGSLAFDAHELITSARAWLRCDAWRFGLLVPIQTLFIFMFERVHLFVSDVFSTILIRGVVERLAL